MVRPCEENEREAPSEKNVRCGHTVEKKKRAVKPKMERRMQERHDRDGSERGQYSKQGSIYRRPQMMGQTREEEEEDMNDGCNTCGIRQLMETHRGNQKENVLYSYI